MYSASDPLCATVGWRLLVQLMAPPISFATMPVLLFRSASEAQLASL